MRPLSIKCENVSFAYSAYTVFQNLNFEITQGQKIALVAPNGAGKTTLLHLLSKMLVPDQGKVSVYKDQKIIEKRKYFSDLGIALPHPYMLMDYTIEENLILHQQFHQNPEFKHAAELAKLFSMTHIMNRKCGNLSFGELRKATLIKALMNHAPYVMLDEPTNGLDDRAKDLLLEYLKTLDGILIIATHDRSWAVDLATDIWTIHDRGVHDF